MMQRLSSWTCRLVLLSTLIPVMVAHAADDPCAVVSLKKRDDVKGQPLYTPDRSRYLVNMEDKNGIPQIYVGDAGNPTPACITCSQVPGGPRVKKTKWMATWHPSGQWIFVGVEREKYQTPPILGLSRSFVKGELQCGLWLDMYAVRPDGQHWVQLTHFQSGVKGVADGYTGPAFTSDGKKAVWSQIIDGNVFKYWPFGRWELVLADVDLSDGDPKLTNQKDITPAGMYWNEPGNFHPNNEDLLISGSAEKNQQGMDQFIINIRTGQLTNLTNTPTVWDEHGLFSPDGKKIIWMSAYPYRTDPSASKFHAIKTEFMIMNSDGSDVRQLTHFRTPGYPESGGGIAACPDWAPDGRSVVLSTLMFPNQDYWDMEFAGNCGNQKTR